LARRLALVPLRDVIRDLPLSKPCGGEKPVVFVRVVGFRVYLVMPGLCRASTSYQCSSKKDVDGRVKPGHDEKELVGWISDLSAVQR
jgi:hypothetical protein